MKNNNSKNRSFITTLLILLGLILCFPFTVKSLPLSHYAKSSVMSSGKWAKIRVNASGMQFVSNSQLQSMGFSDPSKVNVYGYGGRVIGDMLTTNMPDDLPLIPCIRTAGGLIFFGVDNIRWDPSTQKNRLYAHKMHPYSESSYYLLSDRETDGAVIETVDATNTAGLETFDTYFERLLHEKEIMAPSNTGRILLGEDLRSGQQSFSFSLPGNANDYAFAYASFGVNTSGAQGTIRLTSNGSLSQNNVNVPAVSSSEQFMRISNSSLTISDIKDELTINTSFSSAGVVSLARLDFIEVIYERLLSMPSDQLYFYLNEKTDCAARLSGITAETEIWDVTVGHEPQRLTFSRSGDIATFLVPQGFREYVAFNPSKVNRPVESAGEVVNQDIHAMETPDMLIISPAEYLNAARKVAAIHAEADGLLAHVLTPEEIYNEFSSGTPDVSAFRKLLKMWYDRGLKEGSTEDSKLKYCLIYSRPSYDNKMITETVKKAGYPRVPIWQSESGTTENTSYSTDDFIGMLDDNEASFTMGAAKIRVAVGRFPVRSVEEADLAAEKLSEYLLNPEKATWRNNVMIIADDQDDGKHLEQAQDMYIGMYGSPKGYDYQYERLYLDTYPLELTASGQEYPAAKARMMSKIEEGQALIGYVGHANTVSWTHEHLLNWKDITSFNNSRWPVLFAATCEFARWDSDEYSGAEVMWAFPKAGIIATICPSRSVFISQNGPLAEQFGNFAFTIDSDGRAGTLGDAYLKTKNAIQGNEDNKLRYALIGDPAMKMPIPELNIKVTSIYGTEIEEISYEDLPIIEARSNPVVKGVVTDHSGNIVSDFNGLIYLKLFDALKTIETRGNGSAGKVMYYNDHKTKLFDGVAKVTDGEWEITVYMPAEIENLYVPGRMTYYAVADDGREASGANEKFYVYGYDESAPEDNSGPEITYFTINHSNFNDGDLTHSTPVVYAAFTDESGINLSDAGIGHALTLTLDGTTVYTDVLDFFTPDIETGRGGSIMYQLPELTPGKHELKLSVWDCANNSSYASLGFNVAAVKSPEIFDINTYYSPDGSSIDFVISSDRPLSNLDCKVEVFDLSGLKIWSNSAQEKTGNDSTLKMSWNFSGTSGQRVARGIYICRATVTSPEGREDKKSKKIVVSAP